MSKKLTEMTVGELVDSPEFRHELEEQISMEIGHHDKMKAEASRSGMRLQRSPVTSLRERCLFDAENMTVCYKLILEKQLSPSYFSAAEREYIKVCCQMAAWRTLGKALNKEREEQKETEKGGQDAN